MSKYKKEKESCKRKKKSRGFKCKRKNNLLPKSGNSRKKSEQDPNNKFNMSVQVYFSK